MNPVKPAASEQTSTAGGALPGDRPSDVALASVPARKPWLGEAGAAEGRTATRGWAARRDAVVAVACGVLAVVVTSGLLIRYGVGLGAQTRLVATLIVTTIAPGWWAARVLAPASARFVRCSIAATAGIAPALLGWFAAVHAGRAWGWVIPVVAALVSWVAMARSAPGPAGSARAAATPWWASVGMLVAWLLVLRSVVAGLWSSTPIDGRVAWYQDMSWHLSLTAEAMHRAPLHDPQSAADGTLSYHWFSNAWAAAQALVSGVGVRPVAMVWWDVPVVLAALGLAYGLAVSLGGRVGAGVLAALFIPLAPAVPTVASAMADVDSALVWFSPSHLLVVPVGLLAVWVALALLGVIPAGDSGRRRARDDGRARPTPGLVLLALVVSVECAGSKVSMLPTLLGGVVLVLLVRVARARKAGRGSWSAAAGPAALAAGIALVIVVTAPAFAGGGGGSHLSYGALAGQMRVWVDDPSGGWRDSATMTGLMLVMLVPFSWMLASMFLGMSVGAGRATVDDPTNLHRLEMSVRAGRGALRRRDGAPSGRRPVPGHRVCADGPIFFWGCLGAGLVAMFFLEHPSGSQAYFVRGLAAPLAVVGAAGVAAARQWVTRVRAVAASLAGLLCGLVWVAAPFFTAVHVPRVGWLYPVAIGAAVVVVVVVRGARRGRTGAATFVVALVGFACAPGVHEVLGDPLPAAHLSQVGRKTPGLSGAEVTAAEWIATHNRAHALVATNVHCGAVRTTPHCTADGFWVSGFSESPVLVGGWGYSTSARVHHGAGGLSYLRQPYRPADVARMNDDAFTRPSPALLDALRARGVRYLYADAAASPVSPQLARLVRPVFDRDGVQVFDLG